MNKIRRIGIIIVLVSAFAGCSPQPFVEMQEETGIQPGGENEKRDSVQASEEQPGNAVSGTEEMRTEEMRTEEMRTEETHIEDTQPAEPASKKQSPPQEPEVRTVTLAFAGDINFDDSWYVMDYYHKHASEISDVIDEGFLNRMQGADLFWVNNEFTYTDRGEPIPGKFYTFRSAPENVSLLLEMGADIVGLANNHTYDYGEESMLDTLDTLQGAGIPYVGAGRDLAEAMSPVYFDLDGVKIAYVAASRAEKNLKTPQATEDSAGIQRCYDNTLFLEEIREAAKNADYVIALPHWGREDSTQLEEAQTEGAKAYIDAGADAVIGGHTHCLQSIAFYEDKPVIYSLGDFWFNGKTEDTMLAVLHLSYVFSFEAEEDHAGMTKTSKIISVKTEIVPGVQSGCVTKMSADPKERRRIFDYLENLSAGIHIDDEGMVTLSEND